MHNLDDAQIGDGATYTIFTDAEAGTIIARTATRITWQRDKATLQNGVNSGAPDALTFKPGGFCGHTSGRQRYTYETNPDGARRTFTRRKLSNGQVVWKEVGHPTRSRGCSLTAGRHEHYDFNF